MQVSVGDKYDGWRVVGPVMRVGTRLKVPCQCQCGTKRNVEIHSLGGASKSCGCMRVKTITTHGVCTQSRRLYSCWHNMKSRCENAAIRQYKNYGAKGVRVCEEWSSVTVFVEWALRSGYASNLTLDRIDPTKDYTPDNCRWIPLSKQGGNRRNKQMYTAWGETKSASEWMDDPRCTFKNRRIIRQRVFILGWEPERAFTTLVK